MAPIALNTEANNSIFRTNALDAIALSWNQYVALFAVNRKLLRICLLQQIIVPKFDLLCFDLLLI